jgi:CBS domain-containing protein
VLIGEVMTGSVVTATPETSVREAAELMRERNVGSIVLVDPEGMPVGLLTDRDIVVGAVADGRDPGDHAGDHASTPVVCGRPEMDLEQAAELMMRHKIRRLPVLDGDRLTGIVTLDELVTRTGDTQVAHTITSAPTRSAVPGFYFFNRGG